MATHPKRMGFKSDFDFDEQIPISVLRIVLYVPF